MRFDHNGQMAEKNQKRIPTFKIPMRVMGEALVFVKFTVWDANGWCSEMDLYHPGVGVA